MDRMLRNDNDCLSLHCASSPLRFTTDGTRCRHTKLTRFCPVRENRFPRKGFTLVELLVVIAVIGLLMAISLPAVHQALEAARQTRCRANLRQIGIALHNFEASERTLPSGVDFKLLQRHSWCTRILPSIDQAALFQRYDWNSAWNDPVSNQSVTSVNLSLFQCPSSGSDFSGETDYGGNYGSSLTGLVPGTLLGEAWEAGALIAVNAGFPRTRRKPTRFAEFSDGLSSTFLVLESCDRPPDNGSWGIGTNCLAIEHPINAAGQTGGTIISRHTGGGHALFCDGHVRFLSASTDLNVLGAFSTRAGGEASLP